MTSIPKLRDTFTKVAHCLDLYYCRVGRHGQIGRFRDVQHNQRNRGEKVLVRTARGVESGDLLAPCQEASNLISKQSQVEALAVVDLTSIDGKILRTMTPEDLLLQRQLLLSAKAIGDACQDYLVSIDSRDCLLDIEPMMDGKTLYFHFVGTPDESLASHLQELAELFQRDVQASQFAKLLEHGCGPGCGTEEKGSCGEGGACTVCVIAQACTRNS